MSFKSDKGPHQTSSGETLHSHVDHAIYFRNIDGSETRLYFDLEGRLADVRFFESREKGKK
jgi:hypothetical protein